MENQFVNLLDKLVKKEINEIEVKREDFLLFREAWSQRDDRKHIVGEAHLGGNVTYHWTDTPL